MRSSIIFDIRRGVRQGDVLSCLLFNSAIELVFKRWKSRNIGRGWQIHVNHENLTNLRFADDILVLARSCDELHDMVSTLMTELEVAGLKLNTKKSKILTNKLNICPPQCSKIIFINGKAFHVLKNYEYHRYLGKYVSCSRGRAEIEIKHRISAAWLSFHRFSHTLCNPNISIKKRLRLFQSPTPATEQVLELDRICSALFYFNLV